VGGWWFSVSIAAVVVEGKWGRCTLELKTLDIRKCLNVLVRRPKWKLENVAHERLVLILLIHGTPLLKSESSVVRILPQALFSYSAWFDFFGAQT
jgi:hypothetical protein